MFHAKRIILLILLISFFSCNARQEKPFKEKLDEYLKPYLEMKDFSGTILVAHNGEILERRGYGLANREQAIANSADTKYHIASLSKTFTAAAIVMLSREGLLSINDKLSKYLPDFPNGSKIKIIHLLTHSSGVPDFYSLPEYEELKVKDMTFDGWLALLKTKPLDFTPGKQSSYSNSGYGLLALVIEKASNLRYDQYLAERILKPLGMLNTGIWDDQAVITNGASGYEPWVEPEQLVEAAPYGKSVLFGSGSIYSTVDDLHIWYQAIREKKLFDIESQKHPFGWGVRERFDEDLIEQDGSNPGFVAHMSAFLKEDLCIIVLGNTRNGAINQIKIDVAAMVLKEKYEVPTERKEVEVDTAKLDEYVGVYEISPTSQITIKRDRQYLYLKSNNGYFLPLVPLSETRFFFRQLYTPMTFKRNEIGEVHQLLWNDQFPLKRLN